MIRRVLQDVRLVCLDDREDLQAESLHNHRALLGFDEVRDDVGLSHVEQEVVSEDQGASQLDKGAVTDSQVFDFVGLRL